jgi:hypothetical protein
MTESQRKDPCSSDATPTLEEATEFLRQRDAELGPRSAEAKGGDVPVSEGRMVAWSWDAPRYRQCAKTPRCGVCAACLHPAPYLPTESAADAPLSSRAEAERFFKWMGHKPKADELTVLASMVDRIREESRRESDPKSQGAKEKIPAPQACSFFIALNEYMGTIVHSKRSDEIVQAQLEAWIRGYARGAEGGG